MSRGPQVEIYIILLSLQQQVNPMPLNYTQCKTDSGFGGKKRRRPLIGIPAGRFVGYGDQNFRTPMTLKNGAPSGFGKVNVPFASGAVSSTGAVSPGLADGITK